MTDKEIKRKIRRLLKEATALLLLKSGVEIRDAVLVAAIQEYIKKR